LIVPLLG